MYAQEIGAISVLEAKESTNVMMGGSEDRAAILGPRIKL